MATPASMSIPSVKDWIGAVQDEWQMFSDRKSDYVLGAPIGFGASSVVYTALYHPHPPAPPIPCAVKVLDLDTLPPSSLRLLTKETQLMTLSKHPNVLRVRGTFQEEHRLYIALRLMNAGSVADVMRYKHSGGVSEEVAKCILKQALEGLNYLHVNGFIHRDIKAANLLVDDDGTVLLGDLGVAADLSEQDLPAPGFTVREGSTINRETANGAMASRQDGHIYRLQKRRSFVGTPCWMAPEVVAQKHYDSAADIWSLGITALELCQGRAPNSRDPPSKILMKTLQNEPPTLDRANGQFQYSRAFKEMIDSCLVKDPTKRPTAAQLLDNPFFKGAKRKSYLADTLLSGLPPLVKRQERRKQPSIRSRASIDSWDFSTTVTSHIAAASPGRSSRALSPAREPASTRLSRLSVDNTPTSFPDDDVSGDETSDVDAEADNEEGGASSSRSPSPHSPPVTTLLAAARQSPEIPVLLAPRPVRHGMEGDRNFSSSSSAGSSSPPPIPTPQSSTSSLSTTHKLWKKLSGKLSGSKSSDERDKKRSGFGSILDRTTSRGSEMVGAFLERTSSRTGQLTSRSGIYGK